ncbi:unnamed protein product [Parnassius apollo]|uniref:(apollo) hypothetical protein n=1 Tax=Parnassius apollo TaxID=110799 RepID=A0A8S3WVA3_PARAO|nr:unnamed protein product [Parnassius apollo]
MPASDEPQTTCGEEEMVENETNVNDEPDISLGPISMDTVANQPIATIARDNLESWLCLRPLPKELLEKHIKQLEAQLEEEKRRTQKERMAVTKLQNKLIKRLMFTYAGRNDIRYQLITLQATAKSTIFSGGAFCGILKPETAIDSQT